MSFLSEILSSDVADRIGWTLLHSLWQCAVVALVLAVALQALRTRSANSRYVVACAGMATMLAGFVATFFLLPAPEENEPIAVAAAVDDQLENVPERDSIDLSAGQGIPLASHPVRPGGAVPEAPDAAAIRPDDLGDPTLASVLTTQPEPSVPRPTLSERVASALTPWLPWIATGWLLGVLWLSLRNVGGWLTAQRLRQLGVSPVEPDIAERFSKLVDRMKVSRSVRLLRSAVVEAPTAIGWLRPTILLPLGLITGLTPSELDAIIVHELAHIRRHDYVVNLFQTVIETLLFYHPAVWWISRRIRTERENCCDDWAVAVTGDSLSYARTLTRFGELRHASERRLSVGQAVSADGGSLLSRIRRLLPGPRDDHARPRTWLAGGVALATVALLAVMFSCMNSASGVANNGTGDSVEWHRVGAGDLAAIDVAKTLYEKPGERGFFIRVRVSNLADRPVGLELRDFWEVVYVNQIHAADRADEIPAWTGIWRHASNFDDAAQTKLLADMSEGRLTLVAPGKTVEYYRQHPHWTREHVEKAARRYKYFLMGLNGEQLLTDGRRAEQISCDRMVVQKTMNLWVSTRTPVRWGTVPDNAHVVFEDADASQETIESGRTEPAGRDESASWGEPLNDIQARLRVEKTVRIPGETPTLQCDLRHQGRFRQSWTLRDVEVDGAWYWLLDRPKQEQVITPGQTVSEIPLALSGRLRHAELEALLRLRPGDHTVRARFGIGPVSDPKSGAHMGPAWDVVTNAVRITIEKGKEEASVEEAFTVDDIAERLMDQVDVDAMIDLDTAPAVTGNGDWSDGFDLKLASGYGRTNLDKPRIAPRPGSTVRIMRLDSDEIVDAFREAHRRRPEITAEGTKPVAADGLIAVFTDGVAVTGSRSVPVRLAIVKLDGTVAQGNRHIENRFHYRWWYEKEKQPEATAKPANAADEVFWSKPVNGLQLGVRLFRSEYGFDDAFVASEITLRNVSDQTLSAVSPGHAKSVRILTQDRQPVPEAPKGQASSYKINRMVDVLKAGDSTSVRHREFLSDYLISDVGRLLLQVEYEVTPETGKSLGWAGQLQIDGKDLVGWTGKLAAEASFTIHDRGVIWGESRGPLRAGVIVPPTEYGQPVRITALVRNGSDEPVVAGALASEGKNPRPFFWIYSTKDGDGNVLPGVSLGHPIGGKEGPEPVSVTIPPWRYLVVHDDIPANTINAWVSHLGILDGGSFRLEACFTSHDIKGLTNWSGSVSAGTEARVTVTPWGGEESDGLRTRIHVDKRQYRVGQCVPIAAEVLNTTEKAIVVGMQNDLEVGIRVTDAEGRVVKKLREKNNTGISQRTLQAHERTTLTGYDLALQYDLNRPGRYRVQYLGPEGTFGWLSPLPDSNVVEFGVVAADADAQLGAADTKDTRRFPAAEVFINNHRLGPTNGLTGSLKPTGSVECGHPGHVSKVTWKFLESTPEGDAYHFTRTYPADGKNPDTTEKTVTYHGEPIVVFEDDVQEIGIRPVSTSAAAQSTVTKLVPDQREETATLVEGRWGEEADGLQSGIIFPRRQFKQGEPIEPRVVVRNVGKKPIAYDLRGTGYDAIAGVSRFEVIGPDGVPVADIAQSAQTQMELDDDPLPELKPGAEITVPCNRLDTHHYMRAPGRYRIRWMGLDPLPSKSEMERFMADSFGEEAAKFPDGRAPSLPPSATVEIEVVPSASGGPDGDLVGRFLRILPPGWKIEGATLLADDTKPAGRTGGPGSSVGLVHRPVTGSLANNVGMMVYVMAALSAPASAGTETSPAEYLGRGTLGHVYLWHGDHRDPLARWNHAAHDIAVALDVADPKPQEQKMPDWGRLIDQVLAECARAAEAEKLEPLRYFCEKAKIQTAEGAPLRVSFESNLIPPTKAQPAGRVDSEYPYYRVGLSIRPIGPEGQLDMTVADRAIQWDGASSTRGYIVNRLGVEIVLTVLSDDAKFVKALNAILDREITHILGGEVTFSAGGERAEGKLEFRVAPYDPSAGKKPTLDAGALKSYQDWLKQGRTGDWWSKLPAISGRMPEHMWLPTRLKDEDCRELITGEYDGKTYVLVSDVPGQVMLPKVDGEQSWGLARVYQDKDPRGKPSIGVEFDANGRKLVEALTKASLGSALAIVVDGQVLAAPVVRESLRDRAVITGDFTDEEVRELVKALRGGIPTGNENGAAKIQNGTSDSTTMMHVADTPIAWGKPEGGLRAGLRLFRPVPVAELGRSPKPQIRIGDVAHFGVVVENVSSETIQFTSDPGALSIHDAAGHRVEVGVPPYDGPGGGSVRHRLSPGDQADVPVARCVFAPRFPIYCDRQQTAWASVGPGKYRLSVPAGVIAGSLLTGELELEVLPPDKTALSDRVAAASKEGIDQFTLKVVGMTDQQMGLRSLRLLTFEPKTKYPDNWSTAVIDRAQAEAVIRHMAEAGYLWRSVAEPRDEKRLGKPCYFLSISLGDGLSLNSTTETGSIPLDWGPSTETKLRNLKDVLTGEAAAAMDKLLGRMGQSRADGTATAPTNQSGLEENASEDIGSDSTAWGRAVDGLQCRAWLHSTNVPLGSSLQVNYELRNAGDANIRVLRDDGYPHHVHVEWLDRKTQCSCENKPPFMGDRIGEGRFVTLKPGDTLKGRCSWWGSVESEDAEAVREKASLRVTYFIFPEVTKRYPDVWGPAPAQTEPLRVSSNVVEVNLEPGLPGSRDRREGGYSLEDALLMADLVVQARVESKPKPEKLIEPGYREDETREVLLRRGVRLTVNKRLGGREEAEAVGSVLTADYVTDPRHERALEVSEQVIAFLIRRPSGGEGWILFKAVPPDDRVPSLEGKQVGQFGPAVDGVRCLLAGPHQPISQAKPVEFAVLPRFDPGSAGSSAKYLDRHYEDYQVAIHFENVKTGKIYTRQQNWEGGPPLMASRDQRRTLASDPLPPAYVRVRLLGNEGEAIPPGDYRVTAEYSGGRPDGLDEAWKKDAWRGKARSAPITIQVVTAEPFVEEVELPTKLVLTRSPDGIRGAYSDVDMKTLKVSRRSGYHLGTLTWVKIYKGDEQVATPSEGCQGGVPSPSDGGEYVFGSLSLLPLNRESLRVVVEMEVFETCQRWSHGWTVHEDPNVYKVLWKGKAEGTVAAACEPDAPKGELGKEVNGLRSRLLVDRKSYTFGEPVWIYLDVRNESHAPIHVARSPSMLRWFRITGPTGRQVEPIEDIWGDEDYFTDVLEPGKGRTPTQMLTARYYRLTLPGTYRVEWLGVPAGVVKEGTTPPPAPAVEFEVLPATAAGENRAIEGPSTEYQ